ncbi:MAG: glycosyl transferase [Pseudobutyrivibrio ruminis]|uniref:Peptide O-xylosyltransferase n=1 Tax=Pseudobutyrivibrio ruminis TaxID=46206 RepID=A0A927YQ19_9FIRM|nr:glycosyl transferase [Pseudobutyrivibrio ruminis]
MKHAYLVIAHNQFELLKELVLLLESQSDNDFYIHIDKKANVEDFTKLLDLEKYTNIHIIQKHSVTWGGHSQIECELTLLEAALSSDTEYDYLHIISGVDLPVKSMEYVNDFFEKNKGKEFLYFDVYQDRKNIFSRCKEYHLFQEKLGRKEEGLLYNIERYFIHLQKKLHVNRVKNIEQYLGKGANWVTITSGFAEYVVRNKKIIKKYFWHTRCADEVFMHTLFNMSPYKENLYIPGEDEGIKYTNMVYTDWERGNPYILQDEDIDSLIKSPYLFARKFDNNISIERLKEKIL